MDVAAHLPPLIRDLAVILGVAAIVTFIFRRIHQPVVLGYIVAGIIVGPYTPETISVTDLPNIKIWAELGIIFLMFALGLEFSFRKLVKVGVSSIATAVIQILLMMALGYGFGRLLEWSQMDSVFLGAMISISSTTIIIKAFEELGLKGKKFAQMVFGILIVEDLVAIILMVALSSIILQNGLSILDLTMATGKLVLVVGSWFLIGMFLVPIFLRSIRKHGDNEMLTILSVGLCLALVSLSSYFEYSVALGAFIMGSILAETTDGERIEHLIRPLKDIFGAVFFVSVGMLMDPKILVHHSWTILGVSLLIILGKVFSLTIGSLVTGQSLKNSLRIGLSMAQIGEFSFIIAGLGLTYNVINDVLYPIIVSASLITTFTTPYLIRLAPRLELWVERWIPVNFKKALINHSILIQRTLAGGASDKQGLVKIFFRWLSNAIVVIVVFVLAKTYLEPFLENRFESAPLISVLCWLLAMGISSPFLWGMFQLPAGPDGKNRISPKEDLWGFWALLAGRLMTLLILTGLGLEFFTFWSSISLTIAFIILLSVLFKHQLGPSYHWMEEQFKSGFQTVRHPDGEAEGEGQALANLAPWDTHLINMVVSADSNLVTQKLTDIRILEDYGVNIVAIQRGSLLIMAPKGQEILLPNDHLLLLGTDDQVEVLRPIIEGPSGLTIERRQLSRFQLRQFLIREDSLLNGLTILQTGIKDRYNCMVVGVECHGRRILNPHSQYKIGLHDILWIVGQISEINKMAKDFSP